MTSTADDATSSPWSAGRRVAFRFGAIYFALYSLLNGNVATLPVAVIASHGRTPDWYDSSTNGVVTFLGHAIGLRGELHALDNGDSVGDHVELLCFALVALIGATVWSIRDRHRLEYRRELAVVCLGARYVLAMTVFAYAVFKVFPAQFSVPAPSRLLQTYGASSRMGLLWTFMGASTAYQMFAGWTEMLGCTLLMFRRTATLGALVLLAVLTNVLVMDVCYNVPAKLCVLHLLGMAIVVVITDATRLIDVFLRNRAVQAADLGPPPSRARVAAKVAFVALVLCFEGVPPARLYFAERDGAPLPALYGSYEVEEMRRAGQIVPPLISDASYWRFIAIDRRRAAALMVDGTRTQFRLSPGANGRLALESGASILVVSPVGDGALAVEGTYKGEAIEVRARRTDEARELLVRQLVRWFHDGSDNR
jgi:hypothetical protein